MTATVEGGWCRFCRNEHTPGLIHSMGCPIRIGTKVAMAAWEYGYREGWNGNLHTEREMRNFHPSHSLGEYIGFLEFNEG